MTEADIYPHAFWDSQPNTLRLHSSGRRKAPLAEQSWLSQQVSVVPPQQQAVMKTAKE